MSEPQASRSVLRTHLTRSFLSRTLICGAILVSMMEILGLLEMTTPILERHLGAMGLVRYALLRLPSLAFQTLPLSTLIGALFLLMQMTLNSETASLRAAGLSTRRLLVLLLPSIGIISLVGIAMQEIVAPQAELALAKWWNKTDPHAAGSGHGFWFHAAGDVVHIDSFSEGGRRISKVAVYHRVKGGDLIAADTAPELVYDLRTGWQATHVRSLTLRSNRVDIDQHKDVTLLPASLTPDTLIQLSQNYPVLSFWSLWNILHRGGASSLPRRPIAWRFSRPSPCLFHSARCFSSPCR
ncbi:LptF/LptG family permease [Asaia platycodi]|uniref:LptF/LptG family permease n=1 Tax=Asaia platycodi TaxID=610243 RepID=UPI0006863C65|nr:LptF/LptG family permease [Asaia platycodi]